MPLNKKEQNQKNDGEDDIVDENHNDEDSLIPASLYPTEDTNKSMIK